MPIRNMLTKSMVLRAIENHNPKDGYITFSDIARELLVDWATARKHVMKYDECKVLFFSKQESALDEAEKAIFEYAKTDLSALKYLLSTKGKHRGYGLPTATGTAQTDLLSIEAQPTGGGVNIISNDDINAIEAILNKNKVIDTDFEEIEPQSEEKALKRTV